MDVDFGVGRDVDVDHRLEVGDVEAARRDVGRHQHRAAAIGELHQHLVAFALLELAEQGQRAEALGLQHLHQVAALLLGVAEGERACGRKWFSSRLTACRRSVSLTWYKRWTILPSSCWACTVICCGFFGELRRELRDALGVGGREQQRLALLRALPRDLRDVLEEAHVEHAVGFVEHQRVQRLEVEAAAVEVVHDAARGADHDVGAVLEAGQLAAQRDAAAQRDHLDVFLGAGRGGGFRS